jgi:hypothetical protein
MFLEVLPVPRKKAKTGIIHCGLDDAGNKQN